MPPGSSVIIINLTMNHSQRKALTALPSTEQDWLCIIGRMPGWVQRSTLTNPWRPAVCFIVDRRTDEVLYVGIGQHKDTLAQSVTRTLVNVMMADFSDEIRATAAVLHKPAPGKPASIEFTHDEVYQKLKPNLDAVGIRSTCAPHLGRITEIMRGMATSTGQQASPGILSTLQGDIFAVQRYFALVAAFHRAAPWNFVGNDHVIEVRYPPTSDPFWVVVMGIGGEEFGIALYDSIDIINRLSQKNAPVLFRSVDHEAFALSFNLPFEGACFEDLDLIEQFGLPIDSDEAFPGLVRARTRNGKVELLQTTQQEAQRIMALVQVLPEFISSPVHMAAEDGYPKPAEATLLLPEDDSHGSIHLKFPPEGLAFRPPMHGDENEEDDDFNSDFPLDISPDDLIRALESLMGMSAKKKPKPTAGKPKSAKKSTKKPVKKLPKPKKK